MVMTGPAEQADLCGRGPDQSPVHPVVMTDQLRYNYLRSTGPELQPEHSAVSRSVRSGEQWIGFVGAAVDCGNRRGVIKHRSGAGAGDSDTLQPLRGGVNRNRQQ